MSISKREKLSGWGHTLLRDCESFRPEKKRDVESIVLDHPEPLIARGMGRSYGDASLQPKGTLKTVRLNHFIAFDREQGIVRAQAGVTLAELMEVVIPLGWLPPVIPGTRHVSLGGAFACNVHGKNHFREGEFAEHVYSIRLILADGSSLECSPREHSELFWATAGGMGMTGVIEEITLKLMPIASSSLQTVTYRVDSLHDMIAAFNEYQANANYLVGWIDHTATGDLGRGIFEAARHITIEEGGTSCEGFKPYKTRLSIPCFAPNFLLNRYSMALYNKRRFGKYNTKRTSAITDFNDFFHPLDTMAHWNRLYGKRGFFQYECLLPESPVIADTLHELLAAIHERKLFSFLAVLKYHRDGIGPLTFSKRGYSLALDFPNTHEVRAFLPELDRRLAAMQGRIYLAKDAMLTPEMFSAMYGEQGQAWQKSIRGFDPEGRFSSLMSERLQWKEAA